jgi:hypothetical protein
LTMLNRKWLMIWKTSEKELNRNVKQNGRPLHQTRTSRRQNLRTW